MNKQELIDSLKSKIKEIGGFYGTPIHITKTQATDLLRELEDDWISVDERLPEAGQNVIIIQSPKTTATKDPLFARFDGSEFRPPDPSIYFANGEIGISKWSDIIYWMPLPQPPKTEK